ncbi:integrase core domain-containing protein [Piscirickettsia salmonis]|uniref:integrase core domain-containing protein n=1 Tax=Piscirickettsia salmonis TaxID=1238 RepID=UPI0012B8E352
MLGDFASLDVQNTYRGSDAYVIDYNGDVDLHDKLAEWEAFYNFQRPHSAHSGKTPYEMLKTKLGL